MKRRLIILLAFILVISMIPMQVMAEDSAEMISAEAAVRAEEVSLTEFQPATDKYDDISIPKAMSPEGADEPAVPDFPIEASLSDSVSFMISEDGVMTVSGHGAMPADSYQTTNLYQSYVSKIIVASGITRISEGAFYNFVNATSVSMPATVTSIDKYAFSGCETLTEVKIPSKVKIMTEGVFSFCTRLKAAKIPSGCTTIEPGAFWATAITTAAIPAKVDEVPYMAFPEICKLTGFVNKIKYNGATYRAGAVHVSARRKYDYAFKVLTLVNKERKKRGLKSLKMDKSLLGTAMLRSAETSLYFEHTRPCGLQCFSANSKMYGENIAAGMDTPAAVVRAWMNSPGHKANILGDYTTIGIGCVKIGKYYYWTQCFGKGTASTASASSYKNKTVSQKIKYWTKIGLKFGGSVGTIKRNKSKYMKLNVTGSMSKVKIKCGDFTYKSSNTKVATVSKSGKVYAKKRGKATITATAKGAAKIYVKRTVTVK